MHIVPALLLSFGLLATSPLHAAAECVANPPEKQMGLGALRQKLVAQGYQIKILKVDGNCYEMYGRDGNGRKVEIYFDTTTGKPVKTHLED